MAEFLPFTLLFVSITSSKFVMFFLLFLKSSALWFHPLALFFYQCIYFTRDKSKAKTDAQDAKICKTKQANSSALHNYTFACLSFHV